MAGNGKRLPIIVTGAIAIAGSAACGHFAQRPHQLYPEPTRPADQVAMLSGPVGTVDGTDVSRQGSLFSLLPGCHVVSLREQISEGGMGGAWSAELPRTVYAFHMVAGRSYEIQVVRQSMGVTSGTVTTFGDAPASGGITIRAVERDANGTALGKIAPVRANAEIEACQAGSGEAGAKH